jgi:dTMP kinase
VDGESRRGRAAFVAIEGNDAAGKTTLAGALAAALRQRGLRVAAHAEPGCGPIGALFRRLSAAGGVAPLSFAMLSSADRHEAQAALTRQLHGGACDVIVADRYYLSGLAYHCADGVDPTWYQAVNLGVAKPALYLFLQIDPATAAARRATEDAGYWDRPPIAARLPEAYRACLARVVAMEKARVVQIDAGRPPELVLADALAAVLPMAGRGRRAEGRPA